MLVSKAVVEECLDAVRQELRCLREDARHVTMDLQSLVDLVIRLKLLERLLLGLLEDGELILTQESSESRASCCVSIAAFFDKIRDKLARLFRFKGGDGDV